MFQQSGLNSTLTITQTALRQQAFNLCKGKVCLQVCPFPWGCTALNEAHFTIKQRCSREPLGLFLSLSARVNISGVPADALIVSLVITCFNEHLSHLVMSRHYPQGTVWVGLLCSMFQFGNETQGNLVFFTS